MKKWIKLFVALTLLGSLCLGCASTPKESDIRCPKCGSFFHTKQGAETFDQMMQGRGETRR